MIAVLVPKLRITPVTAPSRPAMMEPTPMMVPVPMITPSTVRNERILCSRTVARASPVAALSSIQVIASSLPFHPKCLDRIQLGGLLRRINSEEEADGCRQRQADYHGRSGHSHWNGREVPHHGRDDPRQDDTD